MILNDFNNIKFVGKGTFSDVFYAELNDKKVAIKKCKDEKHMSCFSAEISFLTKLNNLNCENIIKYHGYFPYKLTRACLILDYLDYDLYYFISKTNYDVKKALDYIKQILNGLQFMHKVLIHADLKPENIMIDKSANLIKIIDFGNAMKNKTHTRNFNVQTIYYRSPEVLYNLPYNFKIDMWSLGCIIYEIFEKKVLFKNLKEKDLMLLIQDKLGKPNLYEYYNHIYIELFKDYQIINKNNLQIDFTNLEINSNENLKKEILYLLNNLVTYNFINRFDTTKCLDLPLFSNFSTYII